VFQQKFQTFNYKTQKKRFIAVHRLFCDVTHRCPMCHKFNKTSQFVRDRGQHWSVADHRELWLRCQSTARWNTVCWKETWDRFFNYGSTHSWRASK